MGDPATLAAVTGLLGVGAFGGALGFLLRLLRSTRRLLDESDQRYREERKDHEATAEKLDAEQDLRRKLQDQLDEVTRELRALRVTVEQQTIVIGQQNIQIGRQTERIGHLEAEVARMSGAGT